MSTHNMENYRKLSFINLSPNTSISVSQISAVKSTYSYGPCQANLVLIAYASSKGSGEPAHPRQNLCCSLIQVVSQEEPSDRKPDPWPL